MNVKCHSKQTAVFPLPVRVLRNPAQHFTADGQGILRIRMKLIFEHADGSLATVETQFERAASQATTTTLIYRVVRQETGGEKALRDCLKQRDKEQAGILADAERVESRNRTLQEEMNQIVRLLGYGCSGLECGNVAKEVEKVLMAQDALKGALLRAETALRSVGENCHLNKLPAIGGAAISAADEIHRLLEINVLTPLQF